MTCKKGCTEIRKVVNRYRDVELYPISCDKIILCKECLEGLLTLIKSVKKPCKKCVGCSHECDVEKHEKANNKAKGEQAK